MQCHGEIFGTGKSPSVQDCPSDEPSIVLSVRIRVVQAIR